MEKVLMLIDFSDATDEVVQFAAQFCPKLDVEICVLHVSGADLDDPKQGRAVLEPKVDAVVQQLRDAGCKAEAKLVFGPALPSILDQLDVIKPSFIIVGSHGHSALRDLIVGSVTQSMLRSARCPVLVVPVLRPVEQVRPEQLQASGWDDYGYPMF